jgi:hypothetical protein
MSTPTGTAPRSAAQMTEDEARLWRQRLRERSESTPRRRASRATARREASRRRAHGLVDRQAARLARNRPAGSFEPDQWCSE